MKVLKSVVSLYTTIAILFFNTLLLLLGILCIVTLYVGPCCTDEEKYIQPIYSQYFDLDSYKRIDQTTAIRLGKDFDQMGERSSYQFNPWTVFYEREFDGEFLNVNAQNMRETIPPDPVYKDKEVLTVWAFGGSTMFGWGMPDTETIASHLQVQLQARLPNYQIQVKNYGHSYWFSSMELAFFISLIRTEGKPDIVLFLDGLNDSAWVGGGYENPYFSGFAHAAWEEQRQSTYMSDSNLSWITFNKSFPLIRLANELKINDEVASTPPNSASVESMNDVFRVVPADPIKRIQEVYTSNREMLKAIADQLGIDIYFFWQPVRWYGVYKYVTPLTNETGYPEAYDLILAEPFPDFYPLHDVLYELEYPFVDANHYSDMGSLIIAEHMGEIIALNWSLNN